MTRKYDLQALRRRIAEQGRTVLYRRSPVAAKELDSAEALSTAIRNDTLLHIPKPETPPKSND